MVVVMRYARFVLLLGAALACSACFQLSTVIRVKPDGSGTIDQRLVFTQAAVAQLRQFAALGGGRGGTSGAFDPLSEQQARDAAATLGPGVTYVPSVPIDSPEGVGRDIRYAFTDVNTLKLDQAPPPPRGMPSPPAGSAAEQRVTFAMTKQANGNSLLTITVPQLPALSGKAQTSGPTAEQLAMFKPMLAGARLSIAVEPAGRLVATSSPYVAGQRVIVLELNLDDLLRDETLLQRLQAARTPEEAKAILKEVPGLKANLEPEITIEFQ